MQAKRFFILSFVVIAIVAVLTSMIAIAVFQKPVLPSGQQGTVQIQGLSADIRNVIVVDSLFESKGISDTVIFSGVIRGNSYQTAVESTSLLAEPCLSNPGACPAPFLINNDGTIVADVTIKRGVNDYLFDKVNEDAGTSKVQVWIENPNPAAGLYRTGWESTKVDNCGTSCYTSTPCTAISKCNIPFDPASQNLINNLKKENTNDEAILHVSILVANDESSGTKDTVITVTGVPETSF